MRNLSLHLRCWIALTVTIATVLTILAVLVILQHDAMLSHLTRQRLSVVAEATAAPFRDVAAMGLPITSVRNAEGLLSRAKETDPDISAIELLSASGDIIKSTGEKLDSELADELSHAQVLNKDGKWDLEDTDSVASGRSIVNESGTLLGSVVAIYPKKELQDRSAHIRKDITLAAVAMLAIFSALSFLLFRLKLLGAIGGVISLQAGLKDTSGEASAAHSDVSNKNPTGEDYGFLTQEVITLHNDLIGASKQYKAAMKEMGYCAAETITPASPFSNPELLNTQLIAIPQTVLDRNAARQILPWAAALVIGPALLLGVVAYISVGQSFHPELVKRTQLIGTIADATMQRTVNAGVPIESMVGGTEYFRHLLAEFPEISYFGVSTDYPIIEVGEDQHTASTLNRALSNTHKLPIYLNGKVVGTVTTQSNSAYIAELFKSVALDLGVIIIVIVLLALELIAVMMSVSLTAPLNRLHYIVALQAAGNFSTCIASLSRDVVDQVSTCLSERAKALHAMFQRARLAAVNGTPPLAETVDLNSIGKAFGLHDIGPRWIRFCSLIDVRLALFLFAAADEMETSFFSIFVKSAHNPIPWLSEGAVTSLPLTAYLIAVLTVTPFVRPLSERFGHRRLFLVAAAATVIAKLGMCVAGNVPAITFFNLMCGAGYAFASLACQDYVLDVAHKDERARSLGLFSAAMFGGIFAGSALGGILADRLGYSAVFVISAALILVSGALIYWQLPHQRHVDSRKTDRPRRSSKDVFATFRNPRFASLAFGIIAPQAILDMVFISYLLSLLMESLGASAADIGRLLMIYFLMIIISGSLYGKLAERGVSARNIVLPGSFIGGTSLLVAATWPSIGMMGFAMIGAGVGHGLVRGPQTAMVMDVAETSLAHLGTNSAIAAARITERSASIVALVCIATAADYIGYVGAVYTIAILVLSGALLYLSASNPSRDS